MPYRVLLVDDEPNVLKGLQRLLLDEPYEIFTAQSGAEALELLGRQEVELVVSDERMPGMQGSQLLAKVRDEYPDTMRIILTGQASLEAATRAINEGGVHRYLLKPCKQQELIGVIRQLLEYRSVIVKAHHLKRINDKQAEVLDGLERANPGITDLERDKSGALVIGEPKYSGNLDEMLADLLSD